MVARSLLPIPTSCVSVCDAPGRALVTNPHECQKIRVGAAGSVPLASRPSSKPAAAGAPEKVPDDPFLLILGQSAEVPIEIPSSRKPSPVGSSSLSWVNLDSDSPRPSRSGVVQVPQEASIQEKLKTLERRVTSLQAQLQAPQSSITKVTAFKPLLT